MGNLSSHVSCWRHLGEMLSIWTVDGTPYFLLFHNNTIPLQPEKCRSRRDRPFISFLIWLLETATCDQKRPQVFCWVSRPLSCDDPDRNWHRYFRKTIQAIQALYHIPSTAKYGWFTPNPSPTNIPTIPIRYKPPETICRAHLFRPYCRYTFPLSLYPSHTYINTAYT